MRLKKWEFTDSLPSIQIELACPHAPDVIRNLAYTMCRHIGFNFLFGKRLDTILHVIRFKYIWIRPSTCDRIRCGFIFFHSGERIIKNNRIRCRIRRMRVEGSRIRKEKVADS